MRIFWAVIGVLLLGAAALVWAKRERTSEAPAAPAPPVSSPADPASERAPATPARSEPAAAAPAESAGAPVEQDAGEPVTTSIYVLEAPPSFTEADRKTLEDEMTKARQAERRDLTRKAPEQLDLPAPATVVTVPAPAVVDEAPTDESAAEEERLADADEAAPTEVGEAAAEAPAAGGAPEGSRIVKQDDGSLRVDDRFVIRGAGTKDDPYRVSWSLLVSANESYNPRLGKTKLAEHIEMLSGKYVRISGFIAFPFMVADVQEMLMMQNQWDGCCIGVPPTAYDAIEVTLAAPATDAERFLQYGAVEGRLKVEPYARSNWLISLYTMDDAKVTPEM